MAKFYSLTTSILIEDFKLLTVGTSISVCLSSVILHISFFYFPGCAICNILLPFLCLGLPDLLQCGCISGVTVPRAGASSPPHSLHFQSRAEWHEDELSGRDQRIPAAIRHEGVVPGSMPTSPAWVVRVGWGAARIPLLGAGKLQAQPLLPLSPVLFWGSPASLRGGNMRTRDRINSACWLSWATSCDPQSISG